MGRVKGNHRDGAEPPGPLESQVKKEMSFENPERGLPEVGNEATRPFPQECKRKPAEPPAE